MSLSDMIQLNVGGVMHLTSRATLVKFEDSMLANMFRVNDDNSLLPAAKVDDKTGVYFLDRDGEMFGYILSYLRSGILHVPDTWQNYEYGKLMTEADYYQIQPLIEDVALKQSAVNCEPEILVVAPFDFTITGTLGTLLRLGIEREKLSPHVGPRDYTHYRSSSAEYSEMQENVIQLGFFVVDENSRKQTKVLIKPNGLEDIRQTKDTIDAIGVDYVLKVLK